MRHFGKVTALLIGMACVLPFMATGATGFTWQDIATLFGPLSQSYQLCFAQKTGPAIDSVSFKRVRVEDGSVQVTKTYPKSAWTAVTTPVNGYCLTDVSLPRSGHYAYEIQVCAGTNCSPWELSTDPAYAQVNGQARAWWIYAYQDPKAPGTPSVTLYRQ
jgi:hypothetical protein